MFSIERKQKVRSKMTGFVEVSQNEMMVVDGGFVVTAAVIGACIVWGFNLGLLAVAVDMCNNQ